MAVSKALEPMTIEQYFEFDANAATKYELYSGKLVPRFGSGDEASAMAGAGEPHRSITPVLGGICHNALRGSACRYFDQDTKVVVRDTGSSYYPDGGIACSKNLVKRSAGAIDNPTVLFEVVSNSSEARDRGEKFHTYKLLPSLRDYVLIGTKSPMIEVLSRQSDDSWNLRAYLKGAIAHIPSVDIDISVDELYEYAVFGPEDDDVA